MSEPLQGEVAWSVITDHATSPFLFWHKVWRQVWKDEFSQIADEDDFLLSASQWLGAMLKRRLFISEGTIHVFKKLSKHFLREVAYVLFGWGGVCLSEESPWNSRCCFYPPASKQSSVADVLEQSLLGWWVYFNTMPPFPGLPDDNFDPPSVRDCQGSIRSSDIVPNVTQCTPNAAFARWREGLSSICSVWLGSSESEWGLPLVCHLQACRCESPWTVDLGHFAGNRQEIAETGAAKGEKEKQEAGRRWSSKRCDTGSKPQRFMS